MGYTIPFNYKWGEPYDNNLPMLMKMAQKKIDGNDDFRLLIVGDTGTGKSSLALHIIEGFSTNADIRSVGLNQKSYAKAVVYSRNQRNAGEKYVSCVYDEANVYSTEVMKSFNRELMRLLGEIRGFNIFHIWCMPNPGRLQQDFLDETFDSLIYIHTKSKTKPRLYYFFSKKDLDKMRKTEGTKSSKAKITLDLLNKKAKKYATYMGCFKAYDGYLLKDYLELKTNKMDERVNDFFEKFGGDRVSMTESAKRLGVSQTTVKRWLEKAINDKDLREEVDYIVNGGGTIYLTSIGHDRFAEYYKNSKRVAI